MKFICWNVRKNTADNIQTDLIAKAMAPVVASGEPWLLAVLENSSGGNEVGVALRNALGGTWSGSVAAGGTAHTKENVVLISNCTVKNAETHIAWQSTFNESYSSAHEAHVQNRIAARGELAPHNFRSSTRNNSVASAIQETHWSADKCRCPVVVTVNDGERDYKFGFVHSPGPREKAMCHEDKSYAISYFKCIMETLQHEGVEGVMGDFNVYGSEPEGTNKGDLVDVSAELGGTTFQKATDSVGDSRLDRVYVRSQFALHSKVGLVNGGSEVSDHIGMSVELKTCGQCLHTLMAAAQSDWDTLSGARHLLDLAYSPSAQPASDTAASASEAASSSSTFMSDA